MFYEAVNLHCAGIGHAIAADCADCLDDEWSHYNRLMNKLGGQYGLLKEVCIAAAVVENWRQEYSLDSVWGEDLPPLYEVWDEVANDLWNNLDKRATRDIVVDTLNRIAQN